MTCLETSIRALTEGTTLRYAVADGKQRPVRRDHLSAERAGNGWALSQLLGSPLKFRVLLNLTPQRAPWLIEGREAPRSAAANLSPQGSTFPGAPLELFPLVLPLVEKDTSHGWINEKPAYSRRDVLATATCQTN